MTQSVTESDPESLDRIVLLERLRLYYRSLNQSILAVVINSSVLCWLLWATVSHRTLTLWYVAVILVAGYRLVIALKFNRSDGERQLERRWYAHMLIGSLLSGLSWGLAGYLLFSDVNVVNQSLLAFVIAGMCAGSIISLSSFQEACISFLVLALLPFVIRLLSVGSESAIQLAIMAVLYLVLMSVFARRAHQTVITGLQMTHLRQRAEITIERQAMYDELTGLPNRRLLHDRITQTLARARRSGTQAALLFLDLDQFKRVNDSLGHSNGDQLLIQVSDRLRRQLRGEDTAARLGGDEFVILLVDIEGDEREVMAKVYRKAEAIRHSIAEPFSLQDTELHISTSVGVSLLPGDGTDNDTLLKHADTAMYRAKEQGRNTVRFFVRDMEESLAKRIKLERLLRAAMADDALELYIQPLVHAERGIYGGEALLRWRHEGEFIPPNEFIPIAEESGLIYQLGDWVLQRACQHLGEIAPVGSAREFTLSVNVSPRQFRQQNFSKKLIAAIEKFNVKPGALALEVTETVLIDNVADTASKMQQLRDYGVSFAIDDFGTGYSSLFYLKRLPLDVLKIDGSFVRDVLTDTNDATIVKAIVTMSDTLGISVVAEGVETEEVHQFLLSIGCRRFQGYLFARPMPVSEFMLLLDPAESPGRTEAP